MLILVNLNVDINQKYQSVFIIWRKKSNLLIFSSLKRHLKRIHSLKIKCTCSFLKKNKPKKLSIIYQFRSPSWQVDSLQLADKKIDGLTGQWVDKTVRCVYVIKKQDAVPRSIFIYWLSLSTYQLINLLIGWPVNPFTYRSINLSPCQSGDPSICRPHNLSTHRPVYLTIRRPVHALNLTLSNYQISFSSFWRTVKPNIRSI